MQIHGQVQNMPNRFWSNHMVAPWGALAVLRTQTAPLAHKRLRACVDEFVFCQSADVCETLDSLFAQIRLLASVRVM